MDQLPEENPLTPSSSVMQNDSPTEPPVQPQWQPPQQPSPSPSPRPSIPRSLIIAIVVIVLVGGGLLAGLPILAANSLQKMVNTADEDTHQILTLNQQQLALEDSVTANALVLADTNSDYQKKPGAFKNIQESIATSKKQDDKILALMRQQADTFQSSALTSLYSQYRQPIETISAALKANAQTAVKANNLSQEDAASALAILQLVTDIQLANEVLTEKDLNTAYQKAEGLQKYVSPDFSFPDASLIKEKDPKSFAAINDGKKLLGNAYNLVQAVKQGNNDSIAQLAQTISQTEPDVDNALLTALSTTKPEWQSIYKDFKTNQEAYISTLKGVSGITFAEHRNVANDVLNILQIARHTDQSYPQTTDFDNLKKVLNLPFGTSDYLRYSSHSKDAFHLEYMDDSTNQWQVLELMSAQPPTPTLTPAPSTQVQ